MKRIIYLAAITFLFLIPCAAQENGAPCPTISFVAPDSPATPGEAMTFFVAVSDTGKNPKLEFEWTISAGSIVEGQGTASIKVATDRLPGAKIIAIVQVKGLNSICKDVAFGTGEIGEICTLPVPPTIYDLSSVEEEHAILDLVLSELMNNPNSVAVLYLNFKMPTDAQINLRISRIRKHFAYRKVPFNDRVIFVIVKSEVDSNAIDLTAKENLRIPLEREDIIKIIKASSLNLKTPAKRK